jgi:periplasmic protein CpxP/Spy
MTGGPSAHNLPAGSRARLLLKQSEAERIMLQLIDPAARSLAAATVLGAVLLAGPAGAAARLPSSAPLQVAQSTAAAPAPQAAPAKPRHRMTMSERVEDHIKRLHAELKITPAQEQQWDAVAQAMRDDAKSMEQAIEQRRQAKSMTAVDDLKAYEAIAETHAQGVQKLIAAFQPLYDSMSPEQKKNADAVFSHAGRRSHRKAPAKPAKPQ